MQQNGKGMIEHVIPGRMRLRFRARRGEEAFFAQLVERLQARPEVTRAVANPRTGSVLVFHAGDPREIAAVAGVVGGEVWGAARPAAPRSAPKLQSVALSALAALQFARGRVFDAASQHLWQAARVRELNLPALALTLIGLGVVQGMRGRFLAPASSLLINAILSQARRTRGSRTALPREAKGGLRASRYARLRPIAPVRRKTPITH